MMMLRLLLTVALVNLAGCQRPTVEMIPPHKEVFSGDLFYLICSPDASTLHFNGKDQHLSGMWKITAASEIHTGDYECEHNGQKSEILSIKVLGYSPMASLTIATGQPVMKTGYSVLLKLENENALTGWMCKVYRRERKRMNSIKVNHRNMTTVTFQTNALMEPETIFWCIDSSDHERSNQVVVRTSDKEVSMEMYPLPAVVGENLVLRCLVWGTDQISNTVFYKDKSVISTTSGSQYMITKVTESNLGEYKCQVIYTHVARNSGPPYNKTSDPQALLVKECSVKAVVSEKNSLSCSCPLCMTGHRYKWYKKVGPLWRHLGEDMTPESSGTYACQGVWTTGRSFLSKPYIYSKGLHGNSEMIIIVLCVCLIGILIISVALYWRWKTNRQGSLGPEYEEVGLRNAEVGENKYEALRRKPGDKQQAEYDTLSPTSSQKRKDNSQGQKDNDNKYEALQRKPGDQQEAEYDTLTPTSSQKREDVKPGQKDNENKYQALQKKPGDQQEAEYDTLTPTSSQKTEDVNPGQKDNENKYQALQKKPGDQQEAEYDTLTPTSSQKTKDVNQGQKDNDNKYQALQRKPGDQQEAEYDTLNPTGSEKR